MVINKNIQLLTYGRSRLAAMCQYPYSMAGNLHGLSFLFGLCVHYTSIQHSAKCLFLYMLCVSTFYSCTEQRAVSDQSTLFQQLDPAQTNIHFSNTLSYDDKFNIYT